MRTLLTTHDVAAMLHTTRRQVTILCAGGDLRAIKSGRQWLIEPQDVTEYLERKANRPRRRRNRAA